MPKIENLSRRLAAFKWKMAQAARARSAQIQHAHFWRYRRGKCHPMSGPLIVSLASYPPRFATLYLTLRCLLNQSLAPDEIVLWIDSGDRAALPVSVLQLEGDVLKIRFVDQNIRSYKKIVPALHFYPTSYLVTADDDVYYERNWLAGLVNSYDTSFPAIICHRAHQPYFDDCGKLLPYGQWGWDIEEACESDNIFPTGVGGVLYPPGILPSMAQDADLFMRLAPEADDVWLYFMGRRVGARYKLSGCRFRPLDWPGSQVSSLNGENVVHGGNDRQIRMLENELGPAHRQ